MVQNSFEIQRIFGKVLCFDKSKNRNFEEINEQKSIFPFFAFM